MEFVLIRYEERRYRQNWGFKNRLKKAKNDAFRTQERWSFLS
jgi:hypothetical protein